MFSREQYALIVKSLSQANTNLSITISTNVVGIVSQGTDNDMAMLISECHRWIIDTGAKII